MENPVIEQLIPLADSHQAMDEYKSGHYEWMRGGACAIGCTVRDARSIGLLPETCEDGDHRALSQVTAVPEWAWRCCDSIFERLPQSDRPAWTPAFLRGASNCSNWDKALALFLIGVLEPCVSFDTHRVVQTVLDLWRRVEAGESCESLAQDFEVASEAAWKEWKGTYWAASEAAWAAWAAWAASEAARTASEAAQTASEAAFKVAFEVAFKVASEAAFEVAFEAAFEAAQTASEAAFKVAFKVASEAAFEAAWAASEAASAQYQRDILLGAMENAS